MEAFEGAKWVSWVQRIRKTYFPADSGRISGQIGHISNHIYRPIRPEIRPESAGKIYGWILWAQETHFAPSNASITHFAASVSLDEVGGNYPIFGQNRSLSQVLPKMGIFPPTSSRLTEPAK